MFLQPLGLENEGYNSQIFSNPTGGTTRPNEIAFSLLFPALVCNCRGTLVYESAQLEILSLKEENELSPSLTVLNFCEIRVFFKLMLTFTYHEGSLQGFPESEGFFKAYFWVKQLKRQTPTKSAK